MPERKHTPLRKASLDVKPTPSQEDKLNEVNMNKSQLIAAIAAGAEISKASSEAFLNAFQKAVTDELASGGEVVIAGFGKFSVTERAARTGRNPATGELMEIPASKGVSFKAQKALKDAVNA